MKIFLAAICLLTAFQILTFGQKKRNLDARDGSDKLDGI